MVGSGGEGGGGHGGEVVCDRFFSFSFRKVLRIFVLSIITGLNYKNWCSSIFVCDRLSSSHFELRRIFVNQILRGE